MEKSIKELVEKAKEESGNDIWDAIAYLHIRINKLNPPEKTFEAPELKALWFGACCPICNEVSCDKECKNFKLRRNNG